MGGTAGKPLSDQTSGEGGEERDTLHQPCQEGTLPSSSFSSNISSITVMSNNHRNLILSCAASDDDPLEQGLGVAQVDDGDAICYGEMGGGQMHGLGRIQSSLITYIGFLERDLYHGPGLLIDHEEKSRCEGVFTLGQLSEGKSTSPFIDRDGKRQDGGLLDGRGLKVMRDAENRVKVHRGNFVNDELDGRASVWTLVDSPEKR